MSKSIKLTLDGKEYTATLNDNRTVEDIVNMLPMELTLQRYAGHEYTIVPFHKNRQSKEFL